jgi:hypothetical protein
MTGQVKEDIISRFGELGIVVEDGKITFNPGLLRKSEFLLTPETYQFVSVQNQVNEIALGINSLAFTFCQVPFVYHVADENAVIVTNKNDASTPLQGSTIDAATSNEIFNRTGLVKQVDVYLNPRLL